MWTALDVSKILRRELDYPRIVVRLTPYRDPDDRRWEVCEVRRRYFGPFEAGGMRFKEARDFLDSFYVHEGPHGEYLPLDPHLMLIAVRGQDGWDRQRRPGALIRRVRDAESRRLAQQSQMFEDIAVDTRRIVAQAADDLGL